MTAWARPYLMTGSSVEVIRRDQGFFHLKWRKSRFSILNQKTRAYTLCSSGRDAVLANLPKPLERAWTPTYAPPSKLLQSFARAITSPLERADGLRNLWQICRRFSQVQLCIRLPNPSHADRYVKCSAPCSCPHVTINARCFSHASRDERQRRNPQKYPP